MTVGEAKGLAREWVVARDNELPDVVGAFLFGSICQRQDEEAFPCTSDVDIRVLVKGAGHDGTEVEGEYCTQAIDYKDVYLEVDYQTLNGLTDPEEVLRDFLLAPAFRVHNVLLDRTGVLAKLHDPVRASYARDTWVRARCRNLEGLARWGLDHAIHPDPPLRGWADEYLERIAGLLMPGLAGAAGIPCIADLGGPSFRKGLSNSRAVLESYGLAEIYRQLLDILGASHVTTQQAAGALEEFEHAFDQAAACVRTRFWSSFFFQPVGRAKLVGGARALVSEGFHREAMLFLAATRSMAQNVFENDATAAIKEGTQEGHRRLMSLLGIESGADINRKAEELRALLPRIMDAAETILARNPAVENR